MSTPVIPLSARSHRTADQPISYFMREAVENPGLISLAAGLVDQESLPGDQIAAAFQELLHDPRAARAALQYGTTQGHAPLREKLLARTCAFDALSPSELNLDPSDVVITTGSQQLLYLIGEALLDPGDLVIAERPSYFVFQGTLNSLGVRTLTVPMDDDGLCPDALDELLATLQRRGEIDRLKLIYLCDYFQNPSGLTLSLPRRERILELARRHGRRQRILVMEDAAYRELRYEGEDLPSLKSFDPRNEHVILAMTFSKPCAPGLKTGYGFLPRDLMGAVLRLKGNHDFGSANLTQHLLDRFLASGEYDHHVAELCRTYRRKRDVMLDALAEAFRPWPQVRWTHPRGGLYVWVTFPPGVLTGPDSLLMRAALREGVLYVPGQFCYAEGNEQGPAYGREARLSFGFVPPESIVEAVRRLARAAAPVLDQFAPRQEKARART